MSTDSLDGHPFASEAPYNFVSEYPNVSDEMLEEYAGFMAELDFLGTSSARNAYALHGDVRTDGEHCYRPESHLDEPDFEEGERMKKVALYFLEEEHHDLFTEAYDGVKQALQEPLYESGEPL